MAIYKYSQYAQQANDNVFDGINTPGSAAPLSGIYRCLGCGKEVTSEEGNPLPPQNHHQHTQAQGSIRWRLAVYADHRAKA